MREVWSICVKYGQYAWSMVNMCGVWSICVEYGQYVWSMVSMREV